jgi:hypothetical protein
MKLEEWKTYRTRFLVQAKQITSTLTFVDHLGRQHCGRKGDYLVESSDGVLSIAPRRIFEDIYVPMSAPDELKLSTATETMSFEPLAIEEIKVPGLNRNTASGNPLRKDLARASVAAADHQRPTESAAPVRGRKLPQPCRDRRPSAPHLGLM